LTPVCRNIIKPNLCKMSMHVNPSSSTSIGSQIPLSDSNYAVSFERNNHGEIFIDNMLVEMIENMYTTDILADEDMRGEGEIHASQSDSEEITNRGRGKGKGKGKGKNREEEEEENEEMHDKLFRNRRRPNLLPSSKPQPYDR